MKLLAFFDRINLNLVQGDSVLARQGLEGLAGLGHEVHLLGHGSSEKLVVHRPADFSLYKRTFSSPLTNFFSFRKLNELIKKESFDLVLAKNLVFPAKTNPWTGCPSPLKPRDSGHYKKLRNLFKQNSLPFVFWVEGVTEKNSLASFFAGQNLEVHLTQLNECNGVVVLSKKQKKLLQEAGVKNEFFCFPASTETRRFKERKAKSRKAGILYLASATSPAELKPFLEKLKQMPNTKLSVTSDESRAMKELLNSMDLSERVEFIGPLDPGKRFSFIPEFGAGLYLRSFGSPIADASTFMKVSEYLAAGLPVIGPGISGLREQVGENLLCFEEKSPKEIESLLLDSTAMQAMARQNRKKAGKEFDVKKNCRKLSLFFEGVVQDA